VRAELAHLGSGARFERGRRAQARRACTLAPHGGAAPADEQDEQDRRDDRHADDKGDQAERRRRRRAADVTEPRGGLQQRKRSRHPAHVQIPR
jgi:hypothetical protein